MILNTGARTDTVQYYTDWLLRRFEEGFVYTRNPVFPNTVTRYELSPDKIDAVLFCSKNYAPIMPRLHEITDKYRTYFYYTITAYGKDVEPNVPSVDESIATLIELSKKVGKQRVAWRYDPVLITNKYTADVHKQTFEYMAARLAPYVDRCIFSFVEMYAKLQNNMPELIPLTVGEKRALAEMLGKTAGKHGMRIQTCGLSGDYTEFGISRSGCSTLEILGRANNCEFRKLKHNGMRDGCNCIESRDVGAYDTCPNGCKYCYANKSAKQVKENIKKHDPFSPIILGSVNPDDKIIKGAQDTYLKTADNQLSFFDL